ncbi:50S ribosomal protein L9 [Chitinispirillales bacterium ANBcel5]|uniref:50S ribosomal protein L9 n=1 Tax=Cellulosispirillum alkaliphilum TaxID=3039283 RepID=UPI002A519932|nr:50S ribosomal protein L9 [Chitinispirillales bacterium ANBcel5]
MEVVLMKDYGNLGKAMDVVAVKDGYARNFLIPSQIAVPATEGNKKVVAQVKETAEHKEEKKIKEARQLAKKIEQVPCTIPVKVGEEDKIYGSVSAQEISDFLKKEGFDVEKRNVDLDEPIKSLGVYSIKINLYKDVYAKLKVWVVKEEK